MNGNSKEQMATREGSRAGRAEQRLKELGITLPAPPEPFGTYVEAVQTGNLLFLTGMLPTEGRGAKFIGRVGSELDVEAGCKAAHLAALNVLAVARK
ncbi:MAG: RidA family protein, partial [Candidatus Acidiferrum sp.]